MNNRKRKARPVRVILAALMLCMGALLIPVTAYAQSDTTAPTVQAELSGENLTVAASDDVSGVAAVYVDGTRITTLVNGGATVKVKDYAGSGQKISVYAVDNAGNQSVTVKLDNPNYQAPVSLPPASVPAPSSSSAPAASSSSSSSSSASSSSSSAPDSSDSSSSSSSETAVPESSSDSAFTPDGTGTVQDNATEEDGKEFFTITTADGNVYYLVIDRQRGQENVYFLNTVTEADLLALAEAGVIPGETAIPGTTEPDPEPDPGTSDPGEEEPEPEPEKESGGMGTILFIVLAVAAAGGAGWYFKIYRPKQQAGLDDDFDDLEDADDGGEYGFDDDEPPFDLDDEAGRDEYEEDDGTGYDPAVDDE